MARYDIEKITCPSCGKTFPVKIYDRIDVKRDPKLKKKVIHGTMFAEHCPHCGEKIRMVYDAMYADPVYRITIALAATDDFYKQAVKEMEKENALRNAKDDIVRDYLNEATLRIVRDDMQLAEKVLIFDNDLDDRVIELLRLVHLTSQQATNPEVTDMLFNIGQTRDGHTQMCFLPMIGRDIVNTPIVLSNLNYSRTADKYYHALQEYKESDLEVNRAWAEKFFASIDAAAAAETEPENTAAAE